MATKQRQADQNIQKQIEQLKQQMYGKPTSYALSSDVSNLGSPSIQTHSYSDITHLRTDLLKIFILTSLAIAAEFGLYYALSKDLIKLPI